MCVCVGVFVCVFCIYIYIYNTSKEQVKQYAVTNMVPVISNKLGFLRKIDHHNAVNKLNLIYWPRIHSWPRVGLDCQKRIAFETS